jgi:hypothetical protein
MKVKTEGVCSVVEEDEEEEEERQRETEREERDSKEQQSEWFQYLNQNTEDNGANAC